MRLENRVGVPAPFGDRFSGQVALDEAGEVVTPGGAGAPNELPPASTIVEVSRLFMPGLVIEIEVTAAATGTV